MCKCHAVINAQLLPRSNRSTVSLTGEERTSSIIISSVHFTKHTPVSHANRFFTPIRFPPPLKVFQQKSVWKKWIHRIQQSCKFGQPALIVAQHIPKGARMRLVPLLFTTFNVAASLCAALRVANERRSVQVGQHDVLAPNRCASAARLLCICLTVNPRETALPLKVYMYEQRAPEQRVLFLGTSQAECILGEGTSSAKRAW